MTLTFDLMVQQELNIYLVKIKFSSRTEFSGEQLHLDVNISLNDDTDKKTLSLVHLNIQCITNKINLLEALVSIHKPIFYVYVSIGCPMKKLN